MRNIPIVRNLVVTDESFGSDLTREDLISRILELEYQFGNLQEDYDELVIRYNDRGEEIARLSVYRDDLEQFNRDKETFDILVQVFEA